MATQAVPFVPGKYIINKVKIISVYPAEKTYEVRGVPVGTIGATTTYTLPAAPKDGYVEIEVEDLQEWCRNWENPKEEYMPLPKPAHVIGNALIEAWIGGVMGREKGGSPGIAIRNESIPVEQQVKELRALQTIYANTLVDDGQTRFNRQDFNIPEEHRRMARWMGRDVPWVAPDRQWSEKKRCPACSEEIPVAATRCHKCYVDLIQWYAQYDPEAKDDPVVKARLDAWRKANTKPAPKFAPKPESSKEETPETEQQR